MLWRYIKAQLMVLLCGGLVGPIFSGGVLRHRPELAC